MLNCSPFLLSLVATPQIGRIKIEYVGTQRMNKNENKNEIKLHLDRRLGCCVFNKLLSLYVRYSIDLKALIGLFNSIDR